ncbi:MAG: 50S ribosomal protein L13 [Patescibacteria group bacterium]|jgi:large subunit ribosomal protein L13
MAKKIERQLHKIDASGKTVGRLATQVALILRGKNRPEYTPNLDEGGIVEISNMAKAKFTGKKLDQKKYFRYSGYPGGLKTLKMRDLMQKNPGDVLKRAVKQMLPANRLRNGMMKRLKIK